MSVSNSGVLRYDGDGMERLDGIAGVRRAASKLEEGRGVAVTVLVGPGFSVWDNRGNALVFDFSDAGLRIGWEFRED